MKASEVKVGQRIVLNMGIVGGRDMDEVCTVTKADARKSLFGDPIVALQVRRYCGELFYTHDHRPNDEVDISNEIGSA